MLLPRAKRVKSKLMVTFVWKGDSWDYTDILTEAPSEVKYFVCTPLAFNSWMFQRDGFVILKSSR